MHNVAHALNNSGCRPTLRQGVYAIPEQEQGCNDNVKFKRLAKEL